MITLQDEKEQNWIFLETDLPENIYTALKNLHTIINKAETRIWREYIYTGALLNPDPEDALNRLDLIIKNLEDPLDLGSVDFDAMSEKLDIQDLNIHNERVGHALMVYKTMSALKTKIERAKKESENAKTRQSKKTRSSENEGD